VPIGVDEEPFPTHPHTPWRLFLSRPARAPIVEMLYRTLRIEVNFDSITAEPASQWVCVRCPRHTIQSQGYGYAEYVRRVMELVGVARDGIKWEEYEKWYPYVLPRRGD
jgi:hypothetical protein